MANIKRLTILGRVPFNTTDYPALNRLLGQLNAPTIGLKITYLRTPLMEDNEIGGKTAYFDFRIHGEEAVSDGWIELALQTIVNSNGKVVVVDCIDIENKEKIAFTIPKKEQQFPCPNLDAS